MSLPKQSMPVKRPDLVDPSSCVDYLNGTDKKRSQSRRSSRSDLGVTKADGGGEETGEAARVRTQIRTFPLGSTPPVLKKTSFQERGDIDAPQVVVVAKYHNSHPSLIKDLAKPRNITSHEVML